MDDFRKDTTFYTQYERFEDVSNLKITNDNFFFSFYFGDNQSDQDLAKKFFKTNFQIISYDDNHESDTELLNVDLENCKIIDGRPFYQHSEKY